VRAPAQLEARQAVVAAVDPEHLVDDGEVE
jgi:hypothetical protein